jgi:hypothetical protein
MVIKVIPVTRRQIKFSQANGAPTNPEQDRTRFRTSGD